MNKALFVFLIIFILPGCRNHNKTEKRIPAAKVGDVILYYDQIPKLIQPGTPDSDSTGIIQNYINKWVKKELVLKKSEENLSTELKDEIENQIDETRTNLLIYEYQRQMMLERMDTIISEEELEDYYDANKNSFVLGSNIVKALYIKLPFETPNLSKIKLLARSDNQKDLQELESLCYQFAEKFDDFNEEWITMDRLSFELQQDIENQENFLKRTTFFETTDSITVYLVNFRDYRLRSSIAPYEYVRDDMKRIIWNNRRLEFIQSLENGIYNEALQENSFKIYR